jgi:hypothetical protein
MENNSGGHLQRTTYVFLTVCLIFLITDLASAGPVLHFNGSQGLITANDAQSTTSAEPVGGPHGAVAQAGEGFTPGPNSHVIPHITPLIWYNGCGPTSAAMVLTYWNWYERQDRYDWVMPTVSTEQTQAVNDVIASPGSISDYALPHDDESTGLRPDKSEPPYGDEHTNNSLADWMNTSKSAYDNFYGWSWFSDMPKAFLGYLQSVNPGKFTVVSYNVKMNDYTLTWDVFKSFINKDFPVTLLVDSNGDGQTDHFVPAFGWDVEKDTNGQEIDYYAYMNTWDGLTHWARWQPMAKGQMYGVYGATILFIEHQPPVYTLTFTPTISLTPTPSFTPLPTFTASLTNTWTYTQTSTWTPTLQSTPAPTLTPTPTPEPVKPYRPDVLIIFLITYALVSSGGAAYLFIRLLLEKRRIP